MKFREDISFSFLENRFQEILKLKKEYRGSLPLIDLGIGEEKDMPSSMVLSALEVALKKKENHKYTDRGVPQFIKDSLDYVNKHYDLNLNENEIAMTLGNKGGLSVIPSLFVQKNDVVLTTKPGYVVLENVARLYGAKIIQLPLKKENNFLPGLSSIDESTWKQVRLFSINYPNNPTGAVATRDFYQALIKKAKQYDFLIVNDAAYLPYTYEEAPLSILSIEGAKEVAIELHTLSKSHNMTGFRIGFMVGNQEVISQYKKVCDLFDSGQYAPIQYAACYALKHPEITEALKEKYYERMQNVVDIMNTHGFDLKMSPGTYYLYIPVPSSFINAKEFSKYLLKECGMMTIPYDEVGSYIRISMTFESQYDLPFYLELDRRLRRLPKE